MQEQRCGGRSTAGDSESLPGTIRPGDNILRNQVTILKPLKPIPMKKRALIATLAILIANSTILIAQTTRGKFLLGELSYIEFLGNGVIGSTNIGYTTFQIKSDGDSNADSKEKMFAMNIAPRVGYFVIDNFAVGLNVFLATESHKASNSSSAFFAVGPFVRYYISTKKVLPFAEVNYSMGSRTYKSGSDGSEFTKFAIQLYGAGLGLAVPIGEKVTFDALAGYHTYVNKNKVDNDNNERLHAGTIGLKLGFTVYLGLD